MATVRFSINPQDATYQVVMAAGAAVVTKNIEVTVDVDGLTAAGVTGTLAKNAVLDALTKVSEFIEQNHMWPPM